MCTLTGTRYHQCGDHLLVSRIEHCHLVNKATWTCPAGVKQLISDSERFCSKCNRSLEESARNLAHKMEYVSSFHSLVKELAVTD